MNTAWKRLTLLGLGAVCVFAVSSSPAADWTTYRGSPQRTGNSDGKAGPDKPKVLWVYTPEVEDPMSKDKKKVKVLEHFVGSPVPAGDRLFLGTVGAFNSGSMYSLALDAKGDKQQLWSRGAPWLKMPTVSSPGIYGNKIVFGSGMHQNDGASLLVWGSDGESPLWEFVQPGKLVHLEGSPVIADKKAYIGGGNAGVLCVDLEKITLDGKEIAPAAVDKELDTRWKALLKKYEEDFKKDPDFTIKPTKDKLPRPAPLKIWQALENKVHIDAPVNLAGDKILAASAFLEKEMEGDRALYWLDAKSGKMLKRVPLPWRNGVNPWGGPSVLDKVIVVTGSNIDYDIVKIGQAKGMVAAFDLETGEMLWEKPLPKAGVQSAAALADGLAIVTATDGKVRAYDLANKGLLRWTYPASGAVGPMFAPPAVVGGTVYAADLQGVVHAINIANGAEKWKLNLGTDPAVKSPGMIYGGPVVHGGKVYVATCTLSDMPGVKDSANKQTVVVCIGQ